MAPASIALRQSLLFPPAGRPAAGLTYLSSGHELDLPWGPSGELPLLLEATACPSPLTPGASVNLEACLVPAGTGSCTAGAQDLRLKVCPQPVVFLEQEMGAFHHSGPRNQRSAPKKAGWSPNRGRTTDRHTCRHTGQSLPGLQPLPPGNCSAAKLTTGFGAWSQTPGGCHRLLLTKNKQKTNQPTNQPKCWEYSARIVLGVSRAFLGRESRARQEHFLICQDCRAVPKSLCKCNPCPTRPRIWRPWVGPGRPQVTGLRIYVTSSHKCVVNACEVHVHLDLHAHCTPVHPMTRAPWPPYSQTVSTWPPAIVMPLPLPHLTSGRTSDLAFCICPSGPVCCEAQGRGICGLSLISR